MLKYFTAAIFLLAYLTGNVVLGGRPSTVGIPQHLDEIHRPYQKFQKRISSLGSARQGEDLRLPEDLEPVSYNIQLLPFIEEGRFTTEGNIEIVFNCIEPTDNLTLNSAEISFENSLVLVEDLTTNSQYQVVAFIDEQESRQMVTFRVAADLQAGHQYRIAFTFTSILNDYLQGFYRSSYVENGVTKYLAVTQFEASDARRAFPCFDEPNMKATFTITLGRKTSMISASNTPIVTTIPIDGVPGYVWDLYEPTPIMSSYLVAFLVAEYNIYDSDPSLSNVKFRILSRPEIIDKMGYSSYIGPKVLEFYESFFGVDYPIAKEDMAAVPDFWPGAMENWGLVTYQEYLLTHEDTDSASQKESVVSVIAHELAHQWFGDLVTTDWWGLIWLNEGFASYQQGFAIDAVEPSLRSRDRFSVDVLHNVLMTDAQESSHAMSYDVQQSPDDMNSVFDAIAYDKGASVIRMAADIVGLETFQRAITLYLTRESYENAVEDDLWQALQDQAEIDGIVLPYPVKDIMHSWTSKKNYPLVTITREYGDSDAAVATQERFLLKERQDYNDTTVYLWYVPLTHISNSSDTTATAWMTDKQVNKTFITLGAASDEWVIFNVNQQGYYRVSYDETNYGLIADQLVANHRKIPMQNRAQLLDDAFVLALTNKISYDHALDMTLYLKYEREYVPWHAVLSEFDYIDVMLFDQPEYFDWKTYLSTLVEPYYNIFGFEESPSDSHMTIYSRNDAVAWACRLKLEDCVINVKATYGALMTQPNTALSANQRSLILNLGVENGGQAEFDFAFQQYKTSGDGSYLVAMCYTRISSIIYDLLEMMVVPNSDIKDPNTLFYYLAANPLGNTMAFDFLVNRWDDVQAAVGVGYMPIFYNYLARRLNAQEDLDKYILLRDNHFDVLGNSSYAQSGIDQVKSNVNWLEINKDEIGTWLMNPSNATAEPSTLPPTETFPTETVPTRTVPITTPISASSTDSTDVSNPTATSPTTTTSTTTASATVPTDSSAMRIKIPKIFFVMIIIVSTILANRN